MRLFFKCVQPLRQLLSSLRLTLHPWSKKSAVGSQRLAPVANPKSQA
jgi:hypothetical protein